MVSTVSKAPRLFDEDAVRVIATGHNGSNVPAVLAQLNLYGFVIVSMPSWSSPESAINSLADWIGLGEPYLPELYRSPEAATFGNVYTDIKQDPDVGHPGFNTNTSQDFHVDGVVEPLSKLRTSLLFCVSPAAHGGRTVLFNSCAAFEALAEVDRAASDVLLADGVLERFATLAYSNASMRGPAFAYDNSGRPITRFSDGRTERWHAPAGREKDLERALVFLRAKYSQEGQGYRVAAGLRSGQCLIMRNDWLSHGREAFRDLKDRPRHLIRALYLSVPRSIESVKS